MATSAAYIDLDEGAAPATPGTGKVRVYAKTDGSTYQKDDAGTETALPGAGGGGDVATDAIWDAAGDLAVGSGANTAAKLAIGNAGGILARINGAVAWNAGTTFPTAAAGDRYYRTDIRGGMEFIYDGTRWRSAQIFTGSAYVVAMTAPTTFGYVPFPSDYPVYVLAVGCRPFVASTNNGSNYWGLLARWVTAANSPTALLSVDTSADSAGAWIAKDDNAVNTALTSSAVLLEFVTTKTGAPGALYCGMSLSYQIIAT